MLTKESWQKATLGEYHAQRQALSRFVLAALVQSEPILDVLRRELRRVSPGVKIETSEIEAVLVQEVLKREILEGDKAEAARRLVARASSRALRVKASGGGAMLSDEVADPAPAVAMPAVPAVVQPTGGDESA